MHQSEKEHRLQLSAGRLLHADYEEAVRQSPPFGDDDAPPYRTAIAEEREVGLRGDHRR